MRFFVDIDMANTLHLEGAELLVFSALSLLASKQPGNGTKEQLANLSRCGSRQTAMRALDSLIDRGLVVKSAAGYNVQNGHDDVQNGHENVQNGRENVQNGQNLKESNKEKENNILNTHKRECVYSHTRTRPAWAPSWEEYNSYCVSRNCLKSTMYAFWDHHEGITNWDIKGDWHAAFRRWQEKDEQKYAREQQRRQLLDPNYR